MTVNSPQAQGSWNTKIRYGDISTGDRGTVAANVDP